MNTMRKLSSLALALSLAFIGNSAHAELDQSFTVSNGAGGVIVANATALDWNEQGSGVAVGVGPYGVFLAPGTQFDFLYQANLVNISNGQETALYSNLDGNSNGVANLGKTFEFTIVSKMREIVLNSIGVGATSYAQFGLVNSPINKVAIYYDTATNANTATGTGFDDGTMVALLTIVSDGTTSDFSGKTAATGQGSARIHATLSSAGDFVNAAYLSGIEDLIIGMGFESNLNYPARSASTTSFHASGADPRFPTYQVKTNDIVFKVDGSNGFTRVPEPGSMLLMGIGMLGLVGAARRRSAKKA